MERRTELVSAVLALGLGLIGGAYIFSGLHTSYVLGAGGSPSPGSLIQPAGRDLGAGVVLLAGVGVGAYLHVVYRLSIGLALLTLSAIALVIGIAYTLVAPGPLVAIWPFLALVMPGWVPAAVALSIGSAAVSMMAAMSPPPRSLLASWPWRKQTSPTWR